MNWENILKTSEFQVFLSEVFGISSTESRNIKPSRSLLNSIHTGTLLERITEDQFMNLMILAEEQDYDEFLKVLETYSSQNVKTNKKEVRQKRYRKNMENPEFVEEKRRREREQKRERRKDPEYREREKTRRGERR